jgi:long-chain fatty acid transport protein
MLSSACGMKRTRFIGGKTMRRILVGGALVLAIVAAMPGTAAAQGYGVFEQGTCMMGRAAAGVAAPCNDGSATFYNPAALALDRDRVLTLGGVLVGPRGGFDTFAGQRLDDMSPNWIPVPGIHFAMPVGQKAAVGFGVFAPYGLTTEWPTSFEGRFTAYETTLKSPMMQPTFAYKFNDAVSVGVGLDVTLNMVELNQRLDLSTQQLAPGITFGQLGVPKFTDFADFNIQGDTMTFGFNLGLMVKPVDSKVSFGARYMGRQKIELDDLDLTTTQINTNLRTPVPLPGIPAGTPIDAILAPQFASGGRLADQTAETELYLPEQLILGVGFRPNERWLLALDYQWVNWSLFKELKFVTSNGLEEVITKNYEDTSGLRFGVEYMASEKMTLRAGTLWHQGAAPEGSITPDLPEGARGEFTLGASFQAMKHIRMDLAYQYINQMDRVGRTQLYPPNTGTYIFGANLLGAGLVWRF